MEDQIICIMIYAFPSLRLGQSFPGPALTVAPLLYSTDELYPSILKPKFHYADFPVTSATNP